MRRLAFASALFSLALLAALPGQALDLRLTLQSVACHDQGATGSAECEAVCPAGYAVLNCTHSYVRLTAGGTCKALARVFGGATDRDGQPSRLPHDRCSFYAICASPGESVSVQGWATCYLE